MLARGAGVPATPPLEPPPWHAPSAAGGNLNEARTEPMARIRPLCKTTLPGARGRLARPDIARVCTAIGNHRGAEGLAHPPPRAHRARASCRTAGRQRRERNGRMALRGVVRVRRTAGATTRRPATEPATEPDTQPTRKLTRKEHQNAAVRARPDAGVAGIV